MKKVPTPKLHPTPATSDAFLSSRHLALFNPSEKTITSTKKEPVNNQFPSEPKEYSLVLGSAPTFSKAALAAAKKAIGSPESCLNPFQCLARTGFETKSSKKGLVLKVSVKAMDKTPDGYV